MKKFIAIISLCCLLASTISSPAVALDYQSKILRSLISKAVRTDAPNENLVNLYNKIRDKFINGENISREEIDTLIRENQALYDELIKTNTCPNNLNFDVSQMLSSNDCLSQEADDPTTQCLDLQAKLIIWLILFLATDSLTYQCKINCESNCFACVPLSVSFLYSTISLFCLVVLYDMYSCQYILR
jgi:hypothetical protein